MEDAFARCHPAVNLLYFALVLTGTMFFWHPACQLLSLGFGLAYLVYLEHWPAVCRRLRWMVPLFVLTALINPAFSHAGATILAYFPSGNPLTLESIWFGLASAGMLLAALCWCFCCADILTTDKIVCLLGRALPALSLLLAMHCALFHGCGGRCRRLQGPRRACRSAAGDCLPRRAAARICAPR